MVHQKEKEKIVSTTLPTVLLNAKKCTPFLFLDSHIDGHIWWGSAFFHLHFITPNPPGRVCTHTCAHAHRHIHPAACNPLSCPYPVDLSSLKNYRQRIYSFGRIPGTTFTYSSNEMGSRLFKPCCLQIKHKGGTSLSGDMAPSFSSCLLFLSNFKLVWKVS